MKIHKYKIKDKIGVPGEGVPGEGVPLAPEYSQGNGQNNVDKDVTQENSLLRLYIVKTSYFAWLLFLQGRASSHYVKCLNH